MTREQLIASMRQSSSFLCVGLDTDFDKLPASFQRAADPLFEYNKIIIDATKDLCVAYKLNLAFYESQGLAGWRSLEKTLAYLPDSHFKIADGKRGDIGNTSRMYAKAFFETLNFDAVTVVPYMGEDSVRPFLEYKGKWVILLALTSNPGSRDFQFEQFQHGEPLYQKVIKKATEWGTPDNMMFVVGATHPGQFKVIRSIVPDYFLLAPGIGAQGGDLQLVARYGMNKDIGLLVNASRSILFATSTGDYAAAARSAAMGMQESMKKVLGEGPVRR